MLATLLVLVSAEATAAPPPTEQAAIFKAAGFKQHGPAWKSGNCNRAESNSYEPGRLETYRDLNGDGRPEAVILEGGAVCYGNTGVHFWLLSKQGDGSWKRMFDLTAIPEFQHTKGVDGWPDIEMNLPGLCTPTWRWNGRTYTLSKKRCKQ